MLLHGLLLVTALELCLTAKILIVPVPMATHVDEAIALGLALKSTSSHTPVIVIPSKFPRRHRFRHLGLGSVAYELSEEEIVLGTVRYHRHITNKTLDPQVSDEDLLKMESAIINYHCVYMARG